VILFGDEGDDILIGSSGDDILIGGTGEIIFVDNIPQLVTVTTDSEGENDVLFGGIGNDILFGGGGSDTLDGGTGDDILLGDGGQVSFVNGQPQIIESRVGSGDSSDTLIGGAGNDIMLGAGGDDDISGGSGNDILIGDGGIITLSGGQPTIVETLDQTLGGNDFLSGGSGNDLMFGGAGSNVFDGTLSEDLIIDFARVTLGTGGIILRLDSSASAGVQGGLTASNVSSLYINETTELPGSITVTGRETGQEGEKFILADTTGLSLKGLFPFSVRSSNGDGFISPQLIFPLHIDVDPGLEDELLQPTDTGDDEDQVEQVDPDEQEFRDEMPQEQQAIPELEVEGDPNSEDELPQVQPIDPEAEDENTAKFSGIELGGLVAALSGWRIKEAKLKKKRYHIQLTDNERVKKGRVLHWDETQVVLIDKQANSQENPWYTAYKKSPVIDTRVR